MIVNAAPNITLNPTSGPPYTVVQVSGSGFTPNRQINVLTWNGTGSITFTADPYGNLNATLRVPTLNPGNYKFTVADSYTHASTQTYFTITQASPTPTLPEFPIATVTIMVLLFIGAAILATRKRIR
jgi:Trk-type K+ transport system membrane component